MIADLIPKMEIEKYKRQTFSLEEIKAAYFAGIIDGEGSLSLVRRNTKRLKNNPTFSKSYAPYVAIVSSTKSLLEWVQTNFDGKIDRIDNKHNHIWRWTTTEDKLVPLFEKVIPFLILKREQAEIIIDFRHNLRWIGHGKTPIPQELKEKREALYQKLRSMHTRNGRPALKGDKNAC